MNPTLRFFPKTELCVAGERRSPWKVLTEYPYERRAGGTNSKSGKLWPPNDVPGGDGRFGNKTRREYPKALFPRGKDDPEWRRLYWCTSKAAFVSRV